jgi:hypothetical protein
MFLGIKQEKEARNGGRRCKKHIPTRNQMEKILEDSRNQTLQGGTHLA